MFLCDSMNEKNKAILLVSAILLILSAAFLYQGIAYSNKALKQSIEIAEKSMNTTLLAIRDYSFKPYTARIKNLLQTSPQIVEAFAQQDKDLLYQLVLPKYQALKKENKYFHIMHFHLPNATTLLRMHNPDYYGDNLKGVRPIVDTVHASKKLLTGYEIGRHGPFYRIVYPVFSQDKYIGALEFGIRAHAVLASLQSKTPHASTAFFLKKKWDKVENILPEQQRIFGSYVLITHGDSLFTALQPDLNLEVKDQHIIAEGREYILHTPQVFTDYQGKAIGGIAVLQDISLLVDAKNSFIFRAILFTAILLFLSFLVLYFTFGKMINKLINAKQEWERTFDSVPDMISILDDQHHIIRANKAMAKHTGASFAEIIGSKCYKIIHCKGEPPSYCPHVKLLEDRKPHSVEIYDDRNMKYLAVTVSPLTDDKGTFFGSVHIVRDITEQKMVEAQRIVTEEKLQKAEKMEAIGLMAGGVAHDLNNILSGVVSSPELLLMQLSRDDKLYQPILAIQKSGKRAAAVVADLLTVARGVATVKTVMSLNILIEDYLASIEHKNLTSPYQQVTVHTELEKELWNIRCSPVHIQKVLMNLITNGVEAIGLTGDVLISTRNQSIDQMRPAVSSLEAGEYVVLTIKDSGSGIAKHDLERIFEPFYTKKVMGRSGTGLGLAVVWNTMKDHGAFIHVDSDESGTTFTLYFPSCREKAIPPQTDSDWKNLIGKGSVLVVDDEAQQCDIASQMLTILGYNVETVSSGEEAVAYCQKTPVDLLLLDMLMEPGINGLQTYQQIIEINPGQKAVIASGFSESSSVLDAKTLGVGSFIKKPYTLNQLGEAVLGELQGIKS